MKASKLALALSLAQLHELSPALRGELQTSLGFPATPLLDTAAGFKGAVATEPAGKGLACPDGVRR